ncbi:hypothetical protein [Variovorax saccharolyticus]|uniref:hypothetical protein n=1 Tax=Variovorax saccharolyticus TaxID=3053516 RepID=UPI002574BFF5|nr:hypothetical protein [Variovorax sp. J22R187]MDM0018911.1 hypothetical protein [Variovorax sp. J22R187]
MATQSPAAGELRPGSVRFHVQDEGRPVSGASVSLYRLLPDEPEPGGTPGTPGTTTTTGRRRGGSPPPPSTSWSEQYIATQTTGVDGRGAFHRQPPGRYVLRCHNQLPVEPVYLDVEPGCDQEACIELGLHISATTTLLRDDCPPNSLGMGLGREGDVIEFRIDYTNSSTRLLQVQHPPRARVDPGNPLVSHWTIPTAGLQELRYAVYAPLIADPDLGGPIPGGDARIGGISTIDAGERPTQAVSGDLGVALLRTGTASTADLSFWQGILNSTEQMSFNSYLRFMNMLFCGDDDLTDLPDFERERFGQKRALREQLRFRRLLPFTDSDAYRAVKAATEAFVMVNCGVLAPRRPFDEARDQAYLKRRDLPLPIGPLEDVFTEDYLVQILGGQPGDKTLPYLAVIRSKLPDIAIKLNPLDVDPERLGQCTGILQDKLANPCMLELIWSYWHEEGMLVQTMNSIARRFQNVRSGERDPLANLEIDPLRPLNNVLWGYVQDEQHRLSIVRRNYEYDHHYGLRLEGKAVQRMQAADSRSRFLEAFHNLLRYCTSFFKQDDDTTVKADAFPVLNALKEVHLILSQGAHNQFGDLPSTARIEMLMQQWMLARPEFREFLPTRIMTAYPEPWMDRVDAMKKVQGWTDTSVLHFRNLAIFGEQVLLSIRWGHWSDVQDPLQAFNWARFFRPQIQGYSHAYRSVTGVELALESPDAKVDATLPSVLLQRRLATQQRAA